MAKLTPDATRTEHGLVINEKIIPWGAVWPKDSGAYKKGAQYKADRLLSGGTGKVKGVTIHNTNDLKNVEEDAEQYTRATWPNANMNDARVHYYVDDINAWQNLREDEVGWHAGDGRKATGGNETTLSIEIIMDGSGSKEDLVKELTIDMVPDGDNRIIAETIGVENYYKLCSVVGGSTIYLQKPESVLRPVRDAHIKAEFNGYNHPELARKYGVTERWVRQLCGEGKLEGQMSLLDYGDEPENTTF